MPVHGPLTRDLESLLREAVLLHREVPLRRRHPVTLHAGIPGGETHSQVDSTEFDDGMRRDLVGALLERTVHLRPRALCWITRSGALELHDRDVIWGSAVHEAWAEVGLPGVFAAVTREGWRDPRTGQGRTWVRLRRNQIAV